MRRRGSAPVLLQTLKRPLWFPRHGLSWASRRGALAVSHIVEATAIADRAVPDRRTAPTLRSTPSSVTRLHPCEPHPGARPCCPWGRLYAIGCKSEAREDAHRVTREILPEVRLEMWIKSHEVVQAFLSSPCWLWVSGVIHMFLLISTVNKCLAGKKNEAPKTAPREGSQRNFLLRYGSGWSA